jgi:hypothetical protein
MVRRHWDLRLALVGIAMGLGALLGSNLATPASADAPMPQARNCLAFGAQESNPEKEDAALGLGMGPGGHCGGTGYDCQSQAF